MSKIMDYVAGLPKGLSDSRKAEALEEVRKMFADGVEEYIKADWTSYAFTGSFGADVPQEVLTLEAEYKQANKAIADIKRISEEEMRIIETSKSKTGSFCKILEALADGYKSLTAETVAEIERYDKQVKTDTGCGEYNDEHFRELKRAHDRVIDAIKSKIDIFVSGIDMRMQDAVTDFYRLDSTMIDSNDLALLKSGISFNENDIHALIRKYSANPTMIRAIADNTQSLNATDKAELVRKLTGKAEMDIYEGFKANNMGFPRDPRIMAIVAGQLDKSLARYKQMLTELDIKPVEVLA